LFWRELTAANSASLNSGCELMKQVTLVSLYGQKPQQLAQLIEQCWQRIENSRLRSIFSPYAIEQIHGTIIGMEKRIDCKEFINANMSAGTKQEMNFDKFVEILENYFDRQSLKIRLGGLSQDYRQFFSFGKSPYERSFQIQWATHKITLIGWPFTGQQDFTSQTILWNFRKTMYDQCFIKHKYQNDNDFFIVIGELENTQSLSDSELSELKKESLQVEESCRQYMSLNPIDLEITDRDLWVAQYEKTTLKPESTKIFSIKSFTPDRSFIKELYQ
jgi:hypothetical protein